MRVEIKFIYSQKASSVIYSNPNVELSELKQEEFEKIIETEQFLERLTGIRVHINVEL